jgi:hypothetical protein
MELERVRHQLRAAGTEPTAIAHAAREGAGVLAAWSVALEGEQPGPLASAARQLARSAELLAHTPQPPKQLSRSSGLALFILAAGKPDSAVGWLIVSREIALLASELGRAQAKSSTPKRSSPSESASRCRHPSRTPRARARGRPRTSSG